MTKQIVSYDTKDGANPAPRVEGPPRASFRDALTEAENQRDRFAQRVGWLKSEGADAETIAYVERLAAIYSVMARLVERVWLDPMIKDRLREIAAEEAREEARAAAVESDAAENNAS